MIDVNDINKAFRDAVSTIINDATYPVIKAKQTDATRPTVPYADVDYLSGVPIAWEEQTYENNIVDEDLTEIINGMREITMTVSFYKDGAENNAQKVYTALTRESIQELFATYGIGLTRRSEIRELTISLDTAWEERAAIDVTVNAISEDSDNVLAILSANVSSDFQ